MFLHPLWLVFKIIADQPDTVERHVKQMDEYMRWFGGFIADTASRHPNEFVVAVVAVVVAVFAATVAVATIRFWNSAAALAKFAKEQAGDMKSTIAAAQKAADAAEQSANHVSRAERPYIFGGFGKREVATEEDRGEYIAAVVTMANYGRTPGVLKTIKVGTAKLSELPDLPVYQDEFFISDLFFPGMTMQDVRPTRAHVKIPADGDYAVFQRVFYEDVLGNSHYSGSIHRLYAEMSRGNMSVLDEPIRPGSAYWATDDDKPNENRRKEAD